jgi:multiple sugar transport system permease protein
MLNPEWGVINSIFKLTGLDGPNWLNDPTLALTLLDADAHLEEPAVLDADPAGRAAGHPSEQYEAARSTAPRAGRSSASSPGRR